MLSTLNLQQKTELYEYLCSFVTPNRKDRFEDIIKKRTRHLTIVIEDIYQPHNASAVLRSCDCFGIQDVHIIENKNKYEVNPDVALGSGNWLSMHKYRNEENNTVECLNQLKTKGYTIIAASPHKNDCLLEDLDISKKTAIMFGSEKDGLTEYALNHAGGFVKIPMQGFTESLNISVSAAITLFTLSSKLRKSSLSWQLSNEEKADILLQWVENTVPKPEMVVKDFITKKGW